MILKEICFSLLLPNKSEKYRIRSVQISSRKWIYLVQSPGPTKKQSSKLVSTTQKNTFLPKIFLYLSLKKQKQKYFSLPYERTNHLARSIKKLKIFLVRKINIYIFLFFFILFTFVSYTTNSYIFGKLNKNLFFFYLPKKSYFYLFT